MRKKSTHKFWVKSECTKSEHELVLVNPVQFVYVRQTELIQSSELDILNFPGSPPNWG